VRQGDRAYQELREQIIDWRLPPGSVLGEVQTSDSLGVSRTPVREALQRLAREGLVRLVPGRGAVVSQMSLWQMREALETQAARLAARNGDRTVFESLRVDLQHEQARLAAGRGEPETGAADYASYYELIRRFDEAVDRSSGNPYLMSALTDLRAHLARLRRLARRSPDRMRRTTDEHLSICAAICAGDEQLAGQATAVHIHNSLQHILATLLEDSMGSNVEVAP